MQLSNRQDFPATPEAVHAMVTDRAFLEHAAQQMGATAWQVEASPAHTRVEASVPAPPEMSRFVGATITVVQTMTWQEPGADGARDGSVRIEVQGLPASLQGVGRLEPTESGSSLTYHGDFTVTVPLLGRTIEKQAAPFITDAIETQGRVGRDWLSR